MIHVDYVEPFLGAGGSWLGIVGEDLVPPVSWMGGKRRYAADIRALLDIRAGKPRSYLLGDSSWWGWVWPMLLDPVTGPEVSMLLRFWRGRDPRALWFWLRDIGPLGRTVEGAAQLLWLQARAASGVPVWWEGGAAVQWASSKVDRAGQRQATEPGLVAGARGDRPADSYGATQRTDRLIATNMAGTVHEAGHKAIDSRLVQWDERGEGLPRRWRRWRPRWRHRRPRHDRGPTRRHPAGPRRFGRLHRRGRRLDADGTGGFGPRADRRGARSALPRQDRLSLCLPPPGRPAHRGDVGAARSPDGAARGGVAACGPRHRLDRRPAEPTGSGEGGVGDLLRGRRPGAAAGASAGCGMTLLLPVALDIVTCRVDLAEVVVEDLGGGRARLPSGVVLSRSEVWAANRAAAWEARVRGGSERGGKR